MALLNSDLFLVQDASTKTNYKLSYQALSQDIAANIDLDTRYVEDSGDNMTGDLTLGVAGSPVITLDADTGRGTFEDVYSDYIRVTNRIDGINGLFITADSSAALGITLTNAGEITIGGDLNVQGDADFQAVVAVSFEGDGSALTNLPIPPAQDLSNYLQKPGTDGDFLIRENSGTITYVAEVDGGEYAS